MQDDSTETPLSRHPFATVWLVLLAVGNAIGLILIDQTFAALRDEGMRLAAQRLDLMKGVMGACHIANLTGVALLFNWRRVGFYTIVVSTCFLFAINLSLGAPVETTLFGLVGPVVLYWSLKVGGHRKAWPKLR
jgi:hypothetical protein